VQTSDAATKEKNEGPKLFRKYRLSPPCKISTTDPGAALSSYGTGEFLSWLSDRQIAPYISVLDRKQQTNGFYTQHEFTPVSEENL
jgi:hypothetical protein